MMEKFQEYIEQNLPDRFRRLKVFRIPVNCDGINYWASYNNGVWKFDPGSNTSTPIITYTSAFTESDIEDKVAVDNIESDNTFSIPGSSDIIDNPAIPAEPIKRGRKEKPVREKKERPVKEKKERPVREKKEKPVKEKKERPVRENRKNKAGAVAEQTDMIQDNNVFEAGCDYDAFEQSMTPAYCKFNEKCNARQRKKLTGRIILAVLNILTGGLITGFGSIATACSANSNIGNSIDYWHYRKVNSVWHTFVLLRLLVAVIIVILFIITFVQMGSAAISFTPSLMN